MEAIISPLAQTEFFLRGQNVQITDSFHLREFECRCGACPYTLMSVDHVHRLQALRNLIKNPIRILSGYRCYARNLAVGGEKNSMHMYGLATDVYAEGLEMGTLASLGREFEGVGIYDTWVHFDSRGFTAFWDKRKARA